MVCLKRYIFINISNRTFCYISLKTRNINNTILNDIKHFTGENIITKPQFSKGRQFFETENIG